jgi:hypothetical protein
MVFVSSSEGWSGGGLWMEGGEKAGDDHKLETRKSERMWPLGGKGG